MAEHASGVKASVGFFSDKGPRERNEDFAGAVFGWELPIPRQEVVAAIADGIGGNKGGREAAETAVRGFLDGFCESPETMEVRRAAARVLNSLNSWIHSLGRQDADLAGMGCTFPALFLRGRIAHVLHVGDTRAYRLSGNRLTCLTLDHTQERGAGRAGVLYRALGVEPELRLDYARQPMARHDRFLLCSDGVHGVLPIEMMADILSGHSASDGTARIRAAMMQLPLIPVPISGQTVDGFLLKALLSDGPYTCLYLAVDEIEGGEVVLKFPKPQLAAVPTYRAAFARETWVGAGGNSPE